MREGKQTGGEREEGEMPISVENLLPAQCYTARGDAYLLAQTLG